MWEAGVGVLIGYLVALWWARRDALKDMAAAQAVFDARLESRQEEITRLRDSFDKSQRAVAAFERRARYLESALLGSAEPR